MKSKKKVVILTESQVKSLMNKLREERDQDGWKAYEVKSSTKVSDTYIKDASIQYYTITNSGIYLKDISIVYINNQYIKNGEIDINELFVV